jgi:hypothetical protein
MKRLTSTILASLARCTICVLLVCVLQSATVQGSLVRGQIGHDQILWWELTESRIVAVWSDGVVACWDRASKQRTIAFKIKDFWFKSPHGHMSLYLLPHRPVLVVVDPTTQEVPTELAHGYRLYNLKTGKLIGFHRPKGYRLEKGRIQNYSTLSIQGLSNNGKSLLGACALDKTVFQVDIESGWNTWYCHDKEIEVGGKNVLIAHDASQFLICTPDSVIAKDRLGNTVWTHSFSDPLYRAYRTAVIKHNNETIFVIAKGVRDLMKTRYIALNSKGHLLWETGRKVLAIASDGNYQAFATQNGVEIGSLPSEETIPLSDFTGLVEAQFSLDCTRLMCLPALRPNREKGDSPYVEVLERPSNLLTSFDVTTGNKVGEIDISKPETLPGKVE